MFKTSKSVLRMAISSACIATAAMSTNMASAQTEGTVVDSQVEMIDPRPMPGNTEIPFTNFNSAPTTSFNYFAGSDASTFAEPTFEQPQAGLPEDRPGAFRNTQYRWYGFVRLDGIYDLEPIGSTDSFVTSSIPVPQGEGDNLSITPRYTRIGFDTSTDVSFSDYDVNTRIELDFFNGNKSGLFGSYPLRSRFLWIEFGPLLVGQASSVFMDFDTFPNVLDYQGPPGMILMRQGLARLKVPVFSENLTTSFGIEQPYSDIQWEGTPGNFIVNPGNGVVTDATLDRNVQSVPDFTGNVRYEGDYGHVQVAGILRQLTFQPAVGSALTEVGHGGNFTGTWHPWAHLFGLPTSGKCATAMSRSRFLWQYAEGTGISRYFQDPNGLGLDAVHSDADGFQAIDSRGYVVAYEQWWGRKWLSNFSYSNMDVDVPAALPGSTFSQGHYATANLIWLPFERMGVGAEFLYGERQNQNQESGKAYRIQTGMQYKF
jgi:hypothetical protein